MATLTDCIAETAEFSIDVTTECGFDYDLLLQARCIIDRTTETADDI